MMMQEALKPTDKELRHVEKEKVKRAIDRLF